MFQSTTVCSRVIITPVSDDDPRWHYGAVLCNGSITWLLRLSAKTDGYVCGVHSRCAWESGIKLLLGRPVFHLPHCTIDSNRVWCAVANDSSQITGAYFFRGSRVRGFPSNNWSQIWLDFPISGIVSFEKKICLIIRNASRKQQIFDGFCMHPFR